jgi:hypothetical protein
MESDPKEQKAVGAASVLIVLQYTCTVQCTLYNQCYNFHTELARVNIGSSSMLMGGSLVPLDGSRQRQQIVTIRIYNPNSPVLPPTAVAQHVISIIYSR